MKKYSFLCSHQLWEETPQTIYFLATCPTRSQPCKHSEQIVSGYTSVCKHQLLSHTLLLSVGVFINLKRFWCLIRFFFHLIIIFFFSHSNLTCSTQVINKQVELFIFYFTWLFVVVKSYFIPGELTLPRGNQNKGCGSHFPLPPQDPDRPWCRPVWPRVTWLPLLLEFVSISSHLSMAIVSRSDGLTKHE